MKDRRWRSGRESILDTTGGVPEQEQRQHGPEPTNEENLTKKSEVLLGTVRNQRQPVDLTNDRQSDCRADSGHGPAHAMRWSPEHQITPDE